MVTLPQTLRRAIETIESHPRPTRVLLGCGIVSSMWWVAMDVIASQRYPGYSYLDQTVSELSAEGAPTRSFLMVANAVPYAVLVSAFGLGVWGAAGRTRAGRVTGALLITNATTGLAGGLLFPMMVRGATGDLRNAMHAPYGAVCILLFLLQMIYGSRLLGSRFRLYTYGTIIVLLVFGVLMGMQSGRMVANEPTAWMGLEERISVYATMLWVALLAAGPLSDEANKASDRRAEPALTSRWMQGDDRALPV